MTHSSPRLFNLVDEAWLPVSGSSPSSLRQTFSIGGRMPQTLGGTPLQRIALFKLLLAIAQAAWTPKGNAEWASGGIAELSRRALGYLESKRDRFSLYGSHPFLQAPAMAKVERLEGVRSLGDAGKAVLLTTISAFAPEPVVDAGGCLHSFVRGSSLLEDIWLNLLDAETLTGLSFFTSGLGTPPWERMPESQTGSIAKKLVSSYMGRLVPLCRFALLSGDGVHCSEGLSHYSRLDGMADLSVAVDRSLKSPKILGCDQAKHPLRHLTSLLPFIDSRKEPGFECRQLSLCLPRAKGRCKELGIWFGGLDADGQCVSFDVRLPKPAFEPGWLNALNDGLRDLESIERLLYGRVLSYFAEFKADDGKGPAALACQCFWSLCERDFQQLVDICDSDGDELDALMKRFFTYALAAYDGVCPNEGAKRFDAWAAHRPGAGHSKVKASKVGSEA